MRALIPALFVLSAALAQPLSAHDRWERRDHCRPRAYACETRRELEPRWGRRGAWERESYWEHRACGHRARREMAPFGVWVRIR